MRRWLSLFLAICILVGMAGCSKSAGGPASAVEAYNHALVDGDADQLATLSCAAWEADAKNELASFSAVKVSLKDMSCREADKDGDTVLVSCSGKIVANYGNEVLEIDLGDRLYQVVSEGGEWRMCGYR